MAGQLCEIILILYSSQSKCHFLKAFRPMWWPIHFYNFCAYLIVLFTVGTISSCFVNREWPVSGMSLIHSGNKWMDRLALQPGKAVSNANNLSFKGFWKYLNNYILKGLSTVCDEDPFCGKLNKATKFDVMLYYTFLSFPIQTSKWW